ncbi:hypothetical protein ON010_g851 [Phytophthora cinnamomi]|nr:hypothetical protein ON010_g851 [Phytophthora cinnamomi]
MRDRVISSTARKLGNAANLQASLRAASIGCPPGALQSSSDPAGETGRLGSRSSVAAPEAGDPRLHCWTPSASCRTRDNVGTSRSVHRATQLCGSPLPLRSDSRAALHRPLRSLQFEVAEGVEPAKAPGTLDTLVVASCSGHDALSQPINDAAGIGKQ